MARGEHGRVTEAHEVLLIPYTACVTNTDRLVLVELEPEVVELLSDRLGGDKLILGRTAVVWLIERYDLVVCVIVFHLFFPFLLLPLTDMVKGMIKL